MCLKNHVAGSFASSPTHRCLNVECAKKPVTQTRYMNIPRWWLYKNYKYVKSDYTEQKRIYFLSSVTSVLIDDLFNCKL